ncbi:alpha/beta hydrolase [Spiribacter aquaticus]|uniref:Alpha/beta hydrolase n=1 Tax=Spiribacter aquaticus TaxID=1935996 RepID=A0A557RJJ1_9GAMM|nr:MULTISPECIES: alpha/beta fold hydrolase [Spiribacter]TVO65329.1 alpha/beta hydrolase [Spiribacter aquaticus]
MPRGNPGPLLAGLCAALPAMALAATPALPPVPDVALEVVECPFTPPLGETPTCLMAELPMDHGDVQADGSLPPQARTIGVHLTLLSNLSSSPDPDPVVFLSGGPGQAGSDAIAGFGGAVELRRNRGVILVDQRGTGLSEPALHCPEVSPPELDRNPFNDGADVDSAAESDRERDPDQALVERFTACHDQWVNEDVDLAQFDTRAAALDLRAIRQALGLRHWNVQGTSYGGRLALDLMRVDPAGIRAVVLNSPLTLQSQATAEFIAERPRRFEGLFAACAADASCVERYGDLERKFKAIAEHFQDKPVVLQFEDPASGEPVRETVVWADVVEALSGHLAFSESATRVPRFIVELYEVAEGRLSLNDREVSAIFSAALNDVIAGLTLGQHLSVKCREDFPVDDAAALESVVESNPLYYPAGDDLQVYRTTCPIWEVGQAPAAFSEPIQPEHPVLVLSGDADGLIPHAVARRLAERLPNAQFVSFHGMGHDVHLNLLCGRSVVANFLDAPNEPIDRSCVSDVGPRFE